MGVSATPSKKQKKMLVRTQMFHQYLRVLFAPTSSLGPEESQEGPINRRISSEAC